MFKDLNLGGRCFHCHDKPLERLLYCEQFIHIRTTFKRYRVKKKMVNYRDSLNYKLDYLIQQLGFEIPTPDIGNTYGVFFKDGAIFKGSLLDCEKYSDRRNNIIDGVPLKIKQIPIDFHKEPHNW